MENKKIVRIFIGGRNSVQVQPFRVVQNRVPNNASKTALYKCGIL
jgi:hypothetical protein